MILILLLILLVYVATIVQLMVGFNRIKRYHPTESKPKNFFAIVVPFRNESKNLPALLESIKKLNYPIDLFEIYDNNVLLLILGLVLTGPVASIVIGILTSKWDLNTIKGNDQTLTDAGKYIGILERLFVFLFIITGHWDGIGFLLAAKSVFRFGDLSNANDRKLTEYILIGTLLSFAIASLIGLSYNYVHQIIN